MLYILLSHSASVMCAVIKLLSHTFVVPKTYEKIHPSFLILEECSALAWEWGQGRSLKGALPWPFQDIQFLGFGMKHFRGISEVFARDQEPDQMSRRGCAYGDVHEVG